MRIYQHLQMNDDFKFVIRFGYQPPNPGWRSKKKVFYFTDIENAIEFACESNQFDDIWISYNKGKYICVDFDYLLDLQKNIQECKENQ